MTEISQERLTAETDSSRIKALIAAAKKVYGPIPGLTTPPRPESLTDRQAVAELLMPVLDKAGLDVAALEKILRQEKRHSPRTPDAAAIERHAAMKTSVVRNMNALASSRRGRGALPFNPPLTETIQPLFTWSWPTGVLVASNLAPGDNWVQAQLDASDGDDGPDGGGQYVSFVFVWNNATGSDANVDVDTSLGFLGYCSVQTFGGWLPEVRASNAHVSAHMAIYQGPDVLSSPIVPVVDLHVDSVWESVSNSAPLDKIVDVSETSLYVPEGASIAVEVFASFVYDNWHGRSVFNFAEPDYRIWTPGLMVTSWPNVIV
jgi:hypothetical protein